MTFITRIPEYMGEGRKGDSVIFITSSFLRTIHCLIIASIHSNLPANELSSFII